MMSKLILAASLIVLAVALLLVTGIVSIDANVNVKLNNTTNFTSPQLNITVPTSLRVCVFGTDTSGFDSLTGINYAGRNVTIRAELLSPETALSTTGCDLLVLKDDVAGRYMSRPVRKAVRDGFEVRGIPLMVEKAAATLDRADSASFGWSIGYPGETLQEIMPVKMDAPGYDAQALGERNYSGTFFIRDAALFSGLKNFEFVNWSVTTIAKTMPAAVDAADLSESSALSITAPSQAGVVYYRKLGYSVYFSFPFASAPSVTRAVVQSLLYDYLQRNYIVLN